MMQETTASPTDSMANEESAGEAHGGVRGAYAQDGGAATAPLDGSRRAGDETPAAAAARVPSAAVADLALISNIPVSLSMEIGRTSITINELLSLGKGSVVELQRMTDEPLDVLVNGTLVAHGEAVVVGERFGIRLTEVISPRERLDKLG